MTEQFEASTAKVTIFGAERKGVPAVYLPTVMREGDKVWQACNEKGCPPFALIELSGFDWNDCMSPWAIPPISKNDTPCTGGADTFLSALTDEIMPAVEKILGGTPSCNIVAGYSLAGLFAVYSLYKTDKFSKAASASGSFWYPNFLRYATEHEFVRRPDCLYFSLGDREAKTSNVYLREVERNTLALCEHMRKRSIATVFVSNPGNHFKNAVPRMADGIVWVLEN